jgi:hypothetical protein
MASRKDATHYFLHVALRHKMELDEAGVTWGVAESALIRYLGVSTSCRDPRA